MRDRKTVKRYLTTAVELGWRPGTDEPTEALTAAVAERHSPARGRGRGEIENRLPTVPARPVPAAPEDEAAPGQELQDVVTRAEDLALKCLSAADQIADAFFAFTGDADRRELARPVETSQADGISAITLPLLARA